MTDKQSTNPDVSFVIPLYNEQETLPALVERLNALMDKNGALDFEVVLVNDGSKDDTETMIQGLALNDGRYHGVFLSRNFGHQLALTAGLSVASGDAVMILDGDLQDPPELFDQFYNYIKEGYDVVYAVREKRKESFFKRVSYNLFYRLLKRISYVDIPLDSGDFCMISKRALDQLNALPEESRFVRGLRSWIGYKQIGITYERQGRYAGEAKYSYKMLFKLAYNGIFNFSEFPIKFITGLGMCTMIVSMIFLIITILKKLIYGTVPAGYTSLLLAIFLFSGVQLISLGVIGEYVLRIFFQVKGRPLFIIKNRIQNKKVL